MKFNKVNISFFLVVIAVVLLYALEAPLRQSYRSWQGFRLSKVTFTNLAGKPFRIAPDYRGYVVFYSEISQCSACLRRLVHLKPLSESYPEVGFQAILRGDGHKAQFETYMVEYQVPGDYLLDREGLLASRLNLSSHPLLLFFNRKQELIAMLPLDLPHDKILKLFHRYINEM